MAFLSKTNVMINFFQKLAVVWAKNANIFTKFFGENIFKIIGRIFAYGAIAFFGQFFEKYKNILLEILAYFFPRFKLYSNFDKKWAGPHFGRQTHLVTLKIGLHKSSKS
jgi:hypothetical protein